MRKPLLMLAALAALLAEPSAHAQRRRPGGPFLPQPYLQSVFPLSVQAGETVDVTVRGTELEGATALWFDHPGLRAFHLKGTTFRVVCATGTPRGHHDIRVAGTYGVSNPRTIVVGNRPTVTETEPNETPDKANAVAVNSVINAESAAANDVDCFAINAKKGQRLLFDLEGERVESRFDATLRLLDPSGVEIAESRDVFGADPFLDVTIPADGRYVLKVHDVTYKGSNEHPYRLTITDGPHVDAISPIAAKAGEPTTFTVYGRNLGGEPTALTVDGRPIEKTTVTITPPAEREDGDGPSRSYVLSTHAARRGFEYVFENAGGEANPVFISFATDPVVLEREPNDEPTKLQEVALPCEISGCFDQPGDLDLYRFKAKKGEVYWVETTAEKLGSPADPVFIIQKVIEKGDPQDLATGDDTPEHGDATRFPASSADAAVRWLVPEDGTYQVAVNDLYSSQRGDVRLVYKLSIRPERPDFSLFLLPDSPSQPDSLTLYSGGRSLAHVLAVRADGFNGPIRVEAVDLPAGVRCDPVVIGPNQNSAPIVFEAAEGTMPVLGTARLIGRARFEDRKEQLSYISGSTKLGPDVTHAALAGGMVWTPAPNPQGGPPLTQARLTRGFVIAVVGESPLNLTATQRNAYVTPGGRLALDLAVVRRAGFAGAVDVTLLNPPTGLANPPTVKLETAARTGTLAVTMPRLISAGDYTLVLQGAGPYPFNKDPKAKDKPNVNLAEPSNAILLRVRTAPASVSAKGGTLKVGSKFDVEVTVTRKDGSADPVTLSLDAPDALKLNADPVQATPGKPAKLVVSAAADSPQGAAAGVAVRVTLPVLGEPFQQDEPLALTIAK